MAIRCLLITQVKKLHIIDRNTGEIEEVEVFVSILGSSKLTYVEASLSQKKGDFIGSLVNTLTFYGGVPAATTEFSPMVTPCKIVAFAPILAFFLM